MPVGQSVMCRLSWLQFCKCETVAFLEMVLLCKRCESVSINVFFFLSKGVQDVAAVEKSCVFSLRLV